MATSMGLLWLVKCGGRGRLDYFGSQGVSMAVNRKVIKGNNSRRMNCRSGPGDRNNETAGARHGEAPGERKMKGGPGDRNQ